MLTIQSAISTLQRQLRRGVADARYVNAQQKSVKTMCWSEVLQQLGIQSLKLNLNGISGKLWTV